MTITTRHTKFEFDEEDRQAIKTVNILIDLIYNAMEEKEAFLDWDGYGMQVMVEFFDHFEMLMERNGGFIECTDLPQKIK